MKEAAGEANMTVITIVLIAIVLGAGGVIINNMMSTAEKNAEDASHGCASGTYWNGTSCVAGSVQPKQG